MNATQMRNNLHSENQVTHIEKISEFQQLEFFR